MRRLISFVLIGSCGLASSCSRQPTSSLLGVSKGFVVSERIGQQYDLFSYEIPEGERVCLTRTSEDELWPAAEPRGPRVAFVVRSSNGSELVVLDTSSGKKRVIRSVEGGQVSRPMWSVDATELVYSVQIPGSLSAIERIQVASETIVHGPYGETPCFGPGKEEITYCTTQTCSLVAVRSEGADECPVLPSPMLFCAYPTWLSDGKRLMFSQWDKSTLRSWLFDRGSAPVELRVGESTHVQACGPGLGGEQILLRCGGSEGWVLGIYLRDSGEWRPLVRNCGSEAWGTRLQAPPR